jgi:predicted RNase H-like HicB family nuclease
MNAPGFGSKVVLGLTGITYRQLDYWARTRLVGASIRQAAGRGSRRVYSFEDLVALRVVARLLDAAVSLQGVRRAVEYLKRHTERPLATLGLIAKGKRVFALTEDPTKMIEATAQGQVVIAIDVEPIVKNLQADVTQLSATREIDVRARGRGYRAVLTPDLEAGGYTIEVPELPGCITEADGLSEAKRMTREAIEAWLDVAALQSVRGRAHAR